MELLFDLIVKLFLTDTNSPNLPDLLLNILNQFFQNKEGGAINFSNTYIKKLLL